jgi:hypothetical protein
MAPTLRLVISYILFFAGSIATVYGQAYQGGIRGLVTDKQGAPLSKAQVSLINEATRITRVSATNSDGQYVFTAVEPAPYTISVASSGFATLEQKSITIGSQQFLTLDYQLEVGTVSQNVEVTSTLPLVDLSDASNGQVLSTHLLQNLVAPMRDPYLFERLNNNVVNASTISGNSKFSDQTGIANVSIAGGPPNANNYLVDGVPITDLQNRSVIVPSIEAVQEINLQANTYDAEVGRTGGGTFNTVLKSGTNTLHGALYGETGQTSWAAKPYFFTKGNPYDIDYYNYAGAIGGPVWIPHIYDGRNKTFFWITEEGYQNRSASTAAVYVPTAAERAGDFSASSVKVYNPFAPLVSCPAPYTPTQKCRQPFPNNKIPSALISPAGAAIAAVFPLPNQTVTRYGQTDFSQSLFAGRRADEFLGKLDHQFFPWWYANFSYIHFHSTVPGTDSLGGLAGASTERTLFRKVDAVAQNNTFTLTPTTVLTVGYGFNRFPNNYVDATNGFDQTSLGLPTSYVSGLQKASFPGVTMQSATSLGNNNPGFAVFYSRSFVAGLAKSLGRHSVKVGYDFRTLSVDFTDNTFSNGTYSFANTFSEELPNAGTVATGADVADLLLGTPASGAVTTTSQLRLNLHYQGIYLQDNFRATSRITLNMGLRYEYELGIRERANRFAVGFDSTVTNPITSTSGVTTKGGIEFAGQNGYPSHCCDDSHTMFSPRVGFAFAATPAVTIRAGYGVFYAPVFYTGNSSVAPGYTQTNTYVASNDGNVTPANSLNNPFPSGVQQPTGNSLGYLTGIGNSLTTMSQYRRSPFVQQYSVDLQQELPWRTVLKIGFVGAKGRNLLPNSNGTGSASNVGTGGSSPGALNIDQLPDQYLSLGSALLSKVSNPYFNHGGAGAIGSSTIAYNQLLRPFPQFSSVNLYTSSAKSLYNALNVKLQKDLSHGVSLLASYTWSTNWDSSWGTSNDFSPGPGLPQDASNLNAEYSRAIYDIPHRFAVGTTVALPLGHGEPFQSGNKLLDYAIGGWSVNAVGYIQSGEPLAVYQNTNNNSSLGAGVQRPNLVGSPCYSGSPESRLNRYIKPNAFSTAPAFTYGNTPRTVSCLGPGSNNWDLSVFRDIHLERATLQFRAEATNAFNTPQFSAPVTKYGAVTFGQIQAQANLPRYVQMGARLSF